MAFDWTAAPLPVSQLWPEVMDAWQRAVLQRRGYVSLPPVSAGDWRAWQQTMSNHGLLPLLYSWLKDCPADQRPPAPVMTALQQTYLQQTALMAMRQRQLDRLLAVLTGAAQQVLMLKGAALAETLYLDPALRPAADIDLLVRPSDYPNARQALLAAGYRSRKGRRPSQINWAGEEEFVMPDDPNCFMVDLHWTLSPFTWAEESGVLETLFEEARSTAVGERRMLVLAPQHALVHAALHLIYANSSNIRLIWVYDMHLLAHQIEEQGSWLEVFSVARQWYGRLALVDGLLLANEWFGTSVPAGLTDPSHSPAMEAETAVYQTVHSSAPAQEKLEDLRLANLSRAHRLSFYYDRILPNRHEIDLNYPRFRKWPYPLKAVGRLAAILANRANRG